MPNGTSRTGPTTRASSPTRNAWRIARSSTNTPMSKAIAARRTSFERRRAAARLSRNEVERIGQLEDALGLAAGNPRFLVQVALLVADVGNQRVLAARKDAVARRALEGLRGLELVAVGTSDQLFPAFVAGTVEVPERRLPLPVAAAGDEDDGDALAFRRIEELERRRQRFRLGLINPGIEAARPAGQLVAAAIAD